MISMLLSGCRALLTRDNLVEVYTDGHAKFDGLKDAIRHAGHHIHMEYFVIRNDELGREITAALADKAREGIEVRLLIDAIGCFELPRHFFGDLIAAGGRVARFPRTCIPYLNLQINHHNHRKIAVIDGQTGYIGGFNIGNEYLGKDRRMGYWRDTHLKINGSAVALLQKQFIRDWNAATHEGLAYTPAYLPPPEVAGDVAVQIVSSGPAADHNQMKAAFLKLISLARKTIFIQTPYFIPDTSVRDALSIAALSGVDVRIMIPCKPNLPFAYWSSYFCIGSLLGRGIRAYAYENGFLHSKSIVVDGIAASVGSANWDPRSLILNFETNAFIYDRRCAALLESAFEQDLGRCTEITAEVYNRRSALVRMRETVSRLFSPIL